MHTRYFQVGGVIEDIPAGFEREAARVPEDHARARRRVRRDPELQRDRAAAPARHLPAGRRDAARRSASPGPLLRAAGNPWDLRKADPYSSYEDFEFKIPVGTVGDNYDRFAVRLAEIYESVKIIEQALDGLPEGPYITEDRKVALPPRHELATSMEALIHHFKLVTEGFRVPPGEVYNPIESPRGELGCFVRSDGSSKPARVHMRDPSFVNLQALSHMVEGSYIADMIATHRDARSDPRRHRPMSTGRRPTQRRASTTARASPGWDDAADLTRTRRRSPTRRRTPVPGGAARGDRGAHGALPRPPLGGAARARGRAARARLVLAGGDRAGRVRDAR